MLIYDQKQKCCLLSKIAAEELNNDILVSNIKLDFCKTAQ